MANHHTQARTTLGAADPIVDWFATFEAWITLTVGWTVVIGAGTTDMYLSSPGEPGSGYTMLFIHIWRVGVGNTVRMEVADDAIPTHITNEGGTVDSGGVADFYFWMTANLECIIIVWALGGACRFIYAGALMSYGTTPINETYTMVATSAHNTCSILRDSAGLWDQDKFNYWNQESDNVNAAAVCDNFHHFGLYCDRTNVIAGQYWFLTGEIGVNTSVAFGDVLTSAVTGFDSTWVVLVDNMNNKFALWTGGTWPTGIPQVPPAHITSTSGLAVNGPGLVTSIANEAALVGWNLQGDPGFPRADPGDVNELMTNVGEVHEGIIIMTISWDNSLSTLELNVQSDLTFTHYTYRGIIIPAFPSAYYVVADRDCVVVAVMNTILTQMPCVWGGKLAMTASDLTDVPNMKMAAACLDQATQAASILRTRGGVWTQAANYRYTDVNTRAGTNANGYDATTYYAHPNPIVYGLYEFVGITKYLGYSDGGGIAHGDDIMVNGVEVNFVLQFNNAPRYCTLRV